MQNTEFVISLRQQKGRHIVSLRIDIILRNCFNFLKLILLNSGHGLPVGLPPTEKKQVSVNTKVILACIETCRSF